MNDILSLNINFEKHVLELRTEEFEEEIPFSEIKISEDNGNRVIKFIGCGQSFMLVGDEDGIVINYYWSE